MFRATHCFFLVVAILSAERSAGFVPSSSSIRSGGIRTVDVSLDVKPQRQQQRVDHADAMMTTRSENRRDFLSQVLGSSLVAVATAVAVGHPTPSFASGGATAGGVYLLSAKQRYNERVVKGVKGYLALESSLKSGSVNEAKAYFAGTEQGTWGDISTAGYLLANAFRRNSSASPDSLPSVQAWKAFVKQLDVLQKQFKKNKDNAAYDAFAASIPLLDSYLALVELPPVMELK